MHTRERRVCCRPEFKCRSRKSHPRRPQRWPRHTSEGLGMRRHDTSSAMAQRGGTHGCRSNAPRRRRHRVVVQQHLRDAGLLHVCVVNVRLGCQRAALEEPHGLQQQPGRRRRHQRTQQRRQRTPRRAPPPTATSRTQERIGTANSDAWCCVPGPAGSRQATSCIFQCKRRTAVSAAC